MTEDFEKLPDNIELLVKQHNHNHNRIDKLQSYNARRAAQKENKAIRNKLVKEKGVIRRKANKLVNENIPPQKFRKEVNE